MTLVRQLLHAGAHPHDAALSAANGADVVSLLQERRRQVACEWGGLGVRGKGALVVFVLLSPLLPLFPFLLPLLPPPPPPSSSSCSSSSSSSLSSLLLLFPLLPPPPPPAPPAPPPLPLPLPPSPPGRSMPGGVAELRKQRPAFGCLGGGFVTACSASNRARSPVKVSQSFNRR